MDTICSAHMVASTLHIIQATCCNNDLNSIAVESIEVANTNTEKKQVGCV